jgi:uncharacterized MnhB-related membrane protein
MVVTRHVERCWTGIGHILGLMVAGALVNAFDVYLSNANQGAVLSPVLFLSAVLLSLLRAREAIEIHHDALLFTNGS